jgi:hypothetical protein
MNSVSLRSTRITRPGSARSASASDSRGAVAQSSSPTTASTARPSRSVVVRSKGDGVPKTSSREAARRDLSCRHLILPRCVSYRTDESTCHTRRSNTSLRTR